MNDKTLLFAPGGVNASTNLAQTDPKSMPKRRQPRHPGIKDTIKGKRNQYVQVRNSDERPVITAPLKKHTLKVIALGGFGEYGKNIIAYEYEDDIIVVDCGIMFPEEEMLGIDFVIPDTRYLEENAHKIKGWLFTHGHEDHIGATPYIIPKKFPDVQMFASQLTAGLIKVKYEEFNHRPPKISVVEGGEKIKLGVFEIEFVQMAHSIPDTLALAIRTPEGMILHVTDWKIDHTPIFGQKTNLAHLARLGQEGVKMLLSDSSNAERSGYTISESIIIKTFDNIFKDGRGRLIITMFASAINRIQQIIEMSIKYRRKIAVSGFSMQKNIEMALKLGYLKSPEGLFIDIHKAQGLSDEKITILATGSQGEEFSALSRMASGEHKQIRIRQNDTVVISASQIPGNEQAISNTINGLFKQGANVIYGRHLDIHASGHASREELKLLIQITNPEYFMPIHGEYRHLKIHARLAEELGIKPHNTFVVDNGEIIEFEKGIGQVIKTKVQSGYVLVDGLGVGDVGNIVLRDRQALAKEGMFVVILTIDKKTGKIITSPDIISRGFIYMRDQEELVHLARKEVVGLFIKHNQRYPMQFDHIKRVVRDKLGDFLFHKTQRRPMIIPVIIEV
ncbi:MAG: ribonuclease J [Candidatus Berkelbacteria bacterium Licking1014_7]|uniref:Ribonuclease J n=1 Tax=Candidatus Berkelbacteria bacterium Licking1014_7 TaxID=2017147 RepID=A0A554LK70_9BACT|nr:MAG: ribonuclease J [Candidatus Berkelbacteria bacterium Licking1014_7]